PPFNRCAVTLLNLFQRSRPPCASIAYVAKSFMLICAQMVEGFCHCYFVEFLHLQNDAKAGFSGHHLCIALRCTFKRDGFDHGGYAAQRAETKCCLTRRGVPRQGAFELAAPKYEVHSRDLNRLRPDAESDRDAAGPQALEGFRNRLAAGSRDQNDAGAAEPVQSFGGVNRSAVEIMMNAKPLGQFRLVGAPSNRYDLESHVPGVLHRQMTKATDTEHSNEVTALRRCVSQRAECRQPCAQQRRRIDRQQVIRDGHEPAGLCEHYLGIATVMMNA